MERVLRLSTAIVLGVVGLVILGFAIYVLAMADAGATERELRSWGPVHRALFVMAHGRYMTAVAGALIVVALAALGLVWWLVKRPARWPLLLVAVGSVVVVIAAQGLRDEIEQGEPRGYRDRSVYVRAARWLATSSTIVLLLLAALAAAAWWASRPRPTPPA